MSDRCIQVGLTLPFDLGDPAGAAALVEGLGYDILASGEHVAFHGPAANAFIALSHAAAVTRHVRLLSAITLAPLYPAVLLAKLAAMTDVVSGGRFELGVGVGGEYPAEFEACGVPVAERGPRTDEALQVVRKLWPGEAVSHHGRFCTFDDLRLQPAPVSGPEPRIWVAGRGAAAMRRAVRYGDVWMPYMYTPAQLGESMAVIRGELAATDRDPGAVAAAVNCFLAVDDDPQRARRTAEAKVSDTYRQDFTGHRGRYLVTGTPDACASRLLEFAAAGAESMILSLACPAEDWAAMAAVVAREVLPLVRGVRV